MDLLHPLLFILMMFSAIASQEENNESNSGKRGESKRKGTVMGKRRDNSGTPRKEYQPKAGHRRRTTTSKPKETATSGGMSLFASLLRRNSYAKGDPPRLDRPTRVQLGIYVNSFYSISEQTMDYSLNFYLRQKWFDPRLAFEIVDGNKQIKLGVGMWNDIWIPDTFFRNEKGASFHSVTVPNKLLSVNATGYVWYVTKISATLSCPMKLQKYPLDTQMCPMMFESFGYTMDTMYFAWLEKPVEVDVSVQLPQFTLQDKILIDCSQNYTGGAYSCLEISFILRRDLGFFLIQIYIPSILVVILSWINFWLNHEAVPARISIGLLTVLAITNQMGTANASLARVSYIKAMDIWMSGCLIFVFASLLEYALVNMYARKMIRPSMDNGEDDLCLKCCPALKIAAYPPSVNAVDNGSATNKKGPAKIVDPAGKHKAEHVDKLSRKAFPISFLIFMVVWWVYYTLPGGGSAD